MELKIFRSQKKVRNFLTPFIIKQFNNLAPVFLKFLFKNKLLIIYKINIVPQITQENLKLLWNGSNILEILCIEI